MITVNKLLEQNNLKITLISTPRNSVDDLIIEIGEPKFLYELYSYFLLTRRIFNNINLSIENKCRRTRNYLKVTRKQIDAVYDLMND